MAVRRLQTAIRQAERRGAGRRILDTAFQFRDGRADRRGAYVCGEETAPIASIEGGGGSPAPACRTAQSGLWGQPTLINNVETFANVLPIVARGGAWYAGLGTAKSTGTKVFALAGKIVNTGLIEVLLRGHPAPGDLRDRGASRTGGPSRRCRPAPLRGLRPRRPPDLPLDYEHLASVGSIVGSGA